jgi:hypothetical protein
MFTLIYIKIHTLSRKLLRMDVQNLRSGFRLGKDSQVPQIPADSGSSSDRSPNDPLKSAHWGAALPPGREGAPDARN